MEENTVQKFSDFSVDEQILKALEDMGFIEPTPIQSQVIPYMLENKDVLAQAPTGTGKTCAFAIPILQNILRDNDDVQVLVLSPTRELVIQTANEFKEVMKYTENIRITSVYGGQDINRQLVNLRKRPQIVCGTPGRVMDHLNRKTLKIQNLKCLVLDEADEMLNMGFREDIDEILRTVPKERQTVLFSATMPKAIVDISKHYQIEPVTLKTKAKESNLPQIEQVAIKVKDNEKVAVMTDLLDSYSYKLCIAFCNTKKRVDELSEILKASGYDAEALHGDLRQSQRDRIMKKYREGNTRILVATDVAARGIDVDDVEAIFNFDAPNDEEYYVHRIGRTARANKSGIAYTFYTSAQSDLITKYERYTKTSMNKFTNDNNNTDMSSKKLANLFKKMGSNLNDTKSFISKALNAYNIEHESSFTELDLLAAALNGETGVTMSANTSRRERPQRTSTPSTRFFVNIGTRDNAESDSIKKFVTQNTGIESENIVDVHLLENFGFIEVKVEEADKMKALNGILYHKREVSCEVAGDRENGAKRRVGTRTGGGSGERRSYDKKPYSSGTSRPARNYGDKPSFERKTESEGRDFSDRPARDSSDRPARSFGDRPARSFGDKPARSFGDKPARSFGDRPARSFGDKPARSFGDKPARSFGDKPARSFGDKPARSFGDKPERSYSDKPARSFDDKPARSYDDKPARSYSDRPARSYNDGAGRSASSAPKGDGARKSTFNKENKFRSPKKW